MRWKAVVCVGLLPALSGCNMAHYASRNLVHEPARLINDLKVRHRLRAEARGAWAEVCRGDPSRADSRAFADGFIDGYVELANDGGPPQPPAAPPPRYRRHADAFTPGGRAAQRDYLAGFQLGAETAAATGRRQFLTVEVALPVPRPEPPLNIHCVPGAGGDHPVPSVVPCPPRPVGPPGALPVPLPAAPPGPPLGPVPPVPSTPLPAPPAPANPGLAPQPTSGAGARGPLRGRYLPGVFVVQADERSRPPAARGGPPPATLPPPEVVLVRRDQLAGPPVARGDRSPSTLPPPTPEANPAAQPEQEPGAAGGRTPTGLPHWLDPGVLPPVGDPP